MRAKILYGPTKSSEWTKIFRDSIQNSGNIPIYCPKSRDVHRKVADADVIFMTCYGYGTTSRCLRKQIRDKAKRFGIPTVLVDASAFDSLEDYYSITINHPKRLGIEYVQSRKNDDKRWKLIKDIVNPQEWIDYNYNIKKKILVLLHNPKGYKSNYVSVQDQIAVFKRTLSQLRKQFGAHEVWESWHPKFYPKHRSRTIKLENMWGKIKLCLGWHTNAMCQAAVNGIPLVCLDEESFVWDIAAHDISEKFITPDRTEWFNQMSWCNWSKDEIRKGKCWELLLSHLFR